MGAACGKLRCCKGKDTDEPIFKEAADRKCTNLPCLLLFAFFWVGMIVIAIVGLQSGDPKALLYGTNYEGKTCGGDDYASLTRTYYPKLTEDILLWAAEGTNDPTEIDFYGVCMESCPNKGDIVCNAEGETALAAEVTARGGAATRATVYADCSTASGYASDSDCRDIFPNCWNVPLETTEYFFRCFWSREKNETVSYTCTSPDSLAGRSYESMSSDEQSQCVTKITQVVTSEEGEAQSNYIVDQMHSVGAVFARLVGDLEKTQVVILVSGGIVAMIFGFVWLLIIRHCAKVMVWITIWLGELMLIVFAIVAYVKAGLVTQADIDSVTSSVTSATNVELAVEIPSELDTTEDDANTQTRWKYIAFVSSGIALLVLLMIVWFRKKIRIAVEIIREASNAVRKMPTLVLYPFFSFVLIVGLIVYWIYIAAAVYSAGESVTGKTLTDTLVSSAGATSLLCPEGTTTYNSTTCADGQLAGEWESNSASKFMLAYHFFGLLWTNQFIHGLSTMVIAGAVAAWYFTPDKKTMKGRPLIKSFRRTCRFHLGTIAFGSAIIAIVQMVRAILAYLDRQSKKAQEKSKLVKFAFKCVACCLWCFEKIVKFITKYAYIYAAIKGDGFLKAARSSVGLIMGNLSQIAIVESITWFLFFLGKIAITVLSGLIAYGWLSQASEFQAGGENELEGPTIPVLVTLIMAFFVASAFLGVYNLSIDTILVCFCEDKKQNDGSADKPYFMSERLAKVINSSKTIYLRQATEESENAEGGETEMVSVQPAQPTAGGPKVAGQEAELEEK